MKDLRLFSIYDIMTLRELIALLAENQSNNSIQWQFHLWHMMAHYITDDYATFFISGKRLAVLIICYAKENCYNEFYWRLYEKLTEDIPKNRYIMLMMTTPEK